MHRPLRTLCNWFRVRRPCREVSIIRLWQKIVAGAAIVLAGSLILVEAKARAEYNRFLSAAISIDSACKSLKNEEGHALTSADLQKIVDQHMLTLASKDEDVLRYESGNMQTSTLLLPPGRPLLNRALMWNGRFLLRASSTKGRVTQCELIVKHDNAF